MLLCKKNVASVKWIEFLMRLNLRDVCQRLLNRYDSNQEISRKKVFGTLIPLALVSSLLVACSRTDKQPTAPIEQKPQIQKSDLVLAQLPSELELLKSAAEKGDGRAALMLARWYRNKRYEFFNPQKTYELGFIAEKFSIADGLGIRADAIDDGAVPINSETSKALYKRVEETPHKAEFSGMDEIKLKYTLQRRANDIDRNKLLQRMSKKIRNEVAAIAGDNNPPLAPNVQELLVKMITSLRNETESGGIESTGKLAYWIGVLLPNYGFSEKEILSIDVTPKIAATDALALAQKAADANDARGIVTLIRLSKDSVSKLKGLHAKVDSFNTPEQTQFIVDLIDEFDNDHSVVHDVFPESRASDVLSLKRQWLGKSGAAGNIGSYGDEAGTYFSAFKFCSFSVIRTETQLEWRQFEQCKRNFQIDGAGAQGALANGIRIGDSESLMMAGIILLDANGVAPDFEKGQDYLRRSARMGNSYAFALLAKLSFTGEKGVPKSSISAYLYSNLMQSIGTKNAYLFSLGFDDKPRFDGMFANVQKELSPLENSLPSESIIEAQRLARNWKRGESLPSLMDADEPSTARGTGFFIDGKGGLITAAHVVTSCKRAMLVESGKTGDILVRDKTNDIALIRFEQTPGAYVRIRDDAPKVGEAVYAYGFPLGGVIAGNGSITAGVVNALTGIENDTTKVQVSAPVQQGNSGGPLFDRHGAVIGMVNSKLNAIRVGKVTGDIPQNVNFAIKNSSLTSFLEVQGIKLARPSWSSSFFSKDGESIAEIGKSVAYQVTCASNRSSQIK